MFDELDKTYVQTLRLADKYIKKDTSFGYTNVKYLDCDAKIAKMYDKAEKCYKKAKTGYISEVEFDKIKELLDPYEIEKLDDKMKTDTIRMCYNEAIGHQKDMQEVLSKKRSHDKSLGKVIETVRKNTEDEQEEIGYNKRVNKIGELINAHNSLYQLIFKYIIKEYKSCLTALSREVENYELNEKDKE